MTASLSPRRAVLLVAHLVFWAVLPGSESNARAGNITYNIVDYPINETDDFSGQPDTLSGTFITNGALGPDADIIGGTVTLKTLQGTFTASFYPSEPTLNFLNGITATPAQLLVTQHSAYITSSKAGSPALNLRYNNAAGFSFYYAVAVQGGSFGSRDPTNPNLLPVPGSIGEHDPWIIATVAPSLWAPAGSGKWSDLNQWSNGVPNADGAVVAISAATAADLTVTLDAPQTVGTLMLGSSGTAGDPTLSGSNSLTFSNTCNYSAATISVNDGTHAINVPAVLASNLVVTSTSSTPWTLRFGTASSITDNGAGYSLTMSASNGVLILSGSNTYTGGTFVDAGTLIVTSSDAIADGTALILSANASTIFGGAAMSQTAAVPEPSTLALLSIAVCGVAIYRSVRSRRK
jgi:autotransporter-associated beta strand protein